MSEMKMYVKPELQILDGTAEGVYMASGDKPVSSNSAYTLKPTNAWDGNKQYDITLTNNTSEKVASISVTVKVNGTVTSISGSVEGVVNGSTATITCNNWGNGFEAGASGTFYMHVTGNGDFSIQ